MKLLHRFCAIVSLILLSGGLFQHHRFGLNATGMSSFIAGSACGFTLSLTVYIFHLRDRITAFEKQIQTLL
jgi:hypothetical protein